MVSCYQYLILTYFCLSFVMTGVIPYGGLSGLEILEQLKQGYRLEKPRDTSRDM